MLPMTQSTKLVSQFNARQAHASPYQEGQPVTSVEEMSGTQTTGLIRQSSTSQAPAGVLVLTTKVDLLLNIL